VCGHHTVKGGSTQHGAFEMRIRNQRDFWSGILFVATGLLFVVLSSQYQIGTAAKMGPGYFPTILGALMATLGGVVAYGSTAKSNPQTELTPVGWREILLVLAAVAVFGYLLTRLGMVLSVIALIGVSAVASHEFKLRDTAISIVVLLALSYLVFVKGLELQFPVWPAFLTN
jgi:NhaP-type Na+/H+ or K+/H+ antiporter